MRAHCFAASVAVVALVCSLNAPVAAQTCAGDCNNDGMVVINELITGVNIALGSAAITACPAVDRDSSGGVSIDEIIAAVGNALRGCPVVAASPTATASSTPTATFTATVTASMTATASATITATPTVTVTDLTPTPTTRPPLLAVEINADRVAPGESAVIGIAVSNGGTRTLSGVVVRAVLPASGITGVERSSISDGGSCNGSCGAGQQVSWTLGDLPAGTGRTVSLALIVVAGQTAPADLTELTTAISVVTSSGTPQVNDAATVVVDRARALALALDVDQDPVPPGGDLRYRLTFGNRGVAPLAGGTARMAIPPGTSFVSASDDVTPQSGIVEWALGDLAAGASGTRDLVVHVDAVAGQVVAAEATLDAGGAQTVAQHLARIEAVSALTVTLDAGPDPVGPGEPVLVSLTVTNRGLTMLPGVQAAVRIPPEVGGVDPAAASGATCNLGASFGCDNLERARWTVGDLAPGKGVSFSLPATVVAGQGGVPGGTVIVFEGDAVATGGAQAVARRSVAVRTGRALEVEIDATPEPVSANGELHYVLSFGNRGVTPVAGGVLTFPVPDGTTFVSASDECAPTAGVVTCAVGDLAPGAGGVREVVVQVGAAADGAPIAAEASLRAGGLQARAEHVSRVETDAALTLSLAIGPSPIAPGEAFQVALTVTNRGLVDLFGLTGSLRVPPESSGFATNVSTGVSCNAGASFGCDPQERALWTIGDLPAGHSATLTLPSGVPTGQTAPTSGTIISFDAEVKANDGTRAETRSSILVRTNRAAELELDATPEIVPAGGTLHYAATFGNRGVATLSAAMLELPLPPGTTMISASNGGALADGVVTWTLGDLAAGASGVREVTLQVEDAATQGTVLPARATLRTGGGEARADALVTVRDALPLAIEVTASPDPVAAGESMAARVTVSNRSPVSLFGVTAALRVPAEVAAWPPNISSPGSTCNAGASFGCDPLERQVWTIGELKPGQGITLSAPPVIPTGQGAPAAGSLISFEADAEANDGTQVFARRTVPLVSSRALELEMDPSPQPVAAGDSLVYTLTFGNRGAGALNGAQLRMPMPAGTSFVLASDGGMLLGDEVVWTLGDLAAGAGGVRQLEVQVDDIALEGSLVLAEAVLSAGAVDARANAAARVQSGVPLALDVTATPDPVTQGQTLLVTVTATNVGLINLFGISASLRVPPEVPNFNVNLTGGGNCSRGATFGCDPLETIGWSLGTVDGLAPAQSVSVSVPPVVPMAAGAPPDGTVISVEVDVRANDGTQVTARPSVRVQ